MTILHSSLQYSTWLWLAFRSLIFLYQFVPKHCSSIAHRNIMRNQWLGLNQNSLFFCVVRLVVQKWHISLDFARCSDIIDVLDSRPITVLNLGFIEKAAFHIGSLHSLYVSLQAVIEQGRMNCSLTWLRSLWPNYISFALVLQEQSASVSSSTLQHAADQ